MGLFSKLKKMFSKKIGAKENSFENSPITQYMLSKPIPLDATLTVDTGLIAVIGAGTKACDLLSEGEYSLNGSTIPKSFRVGNFAKTVKIRKGKSVKEEMQKHFLPTIYFINLKDYEINFESKKFIVKDKVYGNQKIDITFKAKVKVNSGIDFVNSFSIDWGYIKCDKVLWRVSSWLSDDIKEIISKQNYSIEDLYFDKKSTCERMILEINSSFAKLGVTFSELEIDQIKISKGLEKQLSERNSLSQEIGEFTAKINGFESEVDFVRVNEQEINASAPPIAVNPTQVGRLCTKCGHECLNEGLFCPMCGQPLVNERKTCPQCGTNVPDDAKGCFKCGYKFEVNDVKLENVDK